MPIARSARWSPRRRARSMHDADRGESMKTSSLSTLLFVVIVILGCALAYALYGSEPGAGNAAIAGIAILVACIVAGSIKVAAPWHRVVVLRLGRFHGLRGPGLFGIIPIIDTIPFWIDVRVITTAFKAEKTLTR